MPGPTDNSLLDKATPKEHPADGRIDTMPPDSLGQTQWPFGAGFISDREIGDLVVPV